MKLRSAVRFGLAVLLFRTIGACGGGSDLSAPEGPRSGIDTLPPIDTTAPPPPDTTTSPPVPPPPPPPGAPPTHQGIPFGPSLFTQGNSSQLLVPPSALNTAFSALNTDAHGEVLIGQLEAARQAGDRVLLSFAGGPEHYKDDRTGAFSLEKWKRKVDQFKGYDLSSFIADGTLIGNFILDEPNDPKNWNDHTVSLADIEAMAEYSKEIWPDLPAVIRGWPDYLKGYNYRHLDATWIQYHSRFGDLDTWLEKNMRGARELGLAVILGLNVVAGGGSGGLPGYHNDKFAMTASQLRSWGATLLDQPDICAFFMFRYNADYFARPEIQAAMTELSEKAARLPIRACRRAG